jgi:hypothetical protein
VYLNCYNPTFGVSKGEKSYFSLWSALKIALFRADLNSYKRFTDAPKGCKIHKNVTFCGLFGENEKTIVFDAPVVPEKYQISS